MAELSSPTLGDELMTRIYLLLLRLPSPRRSSLVQEGFTQEEVTAALAGLQARGMVGAERPDVIEVYPPDQTLPAYAAELERQARSSLSLIHI